jgi:hypothetical protein
VVEGLEPVVVVVSNKIRRILIKLSNNRTLVGGLGNNTSNSSNNNINSSTSNNNNSRPTTIFTTPERPLRLPGRVIRPFRVTFVTALRPSGQERVLRARDLPPRPEATDKVKALLRPLLANLLEI